MTPAEVALRLSTAGASLVATVVYGFMTDVDPAAIATWAGSTGMIVYIAWRVWADSRAMNAVQETLRAQIAAMTAERDWWRDHAEQADADRHRLAVELAEHKAD